MNARTDREIHVLCGAVHPPSRQRFAEEAEALGRTLRWLDPHAVVAHEGALLCDGRPLLLPHVALARSGGYTSDRALATLHAYEQLGVTLVDSAEAVERCRDKLVAERLLSTAGLPVPGTVAVGGVDGVTSVGGALELLGPLPLVVKPAQGMKGSGVRLALSELELEVALLAEGPLLVQEYMPHEADLRVIVVGGEALGAIRRRPETDFRSNLHLGARAESANLPEDVAWLAVQAAAAVGAEVAGVDLLPREGGWVVLEVNSSPGFDGFEAATGRNVARAILVHALSLAR